MLTASWLNVANK